MPGLGLLAVAAMACAGGAFKQALREDSPAGYYRFIRDHPDSEQAAAAQEHLDFLRLERDPTLVAFDAFNERYPKSRLAEGLRSKMEPQAFEIARAQGTVEAYEAFLLRFPNGTLAARARGNAAYLAAAGFGGDADRLALFAEAHPESDFADEARRSAASVALRSRRSFTRVGLSVRVAASTPEPDRVRRLFAERARRFYEGSGIELVVLPDVADPSASLQWPQARLSIVHEERTVRASISRGSVSRPGLLATTVVELRMGDDESPIFRREFALHVDPIERMDDHSALFSSSAARYWQAFFVPLASWPTNGALRPPLELSGEGIAVAASGDRSVVLYEDGSFQLIEFADPSAPSVLARYTRPMDFKHWSGVRILGERVAIFGEEGIELVGLGESGPQRVASWGREQIGTVFAIESVGESLLVAGARGLMLMPEDGGPVNRVMRRVIKGLAVVGDRLIFTDGDSIFVSTLPLLGKRRVEARLRLGSSFAPGRIRSLGSRAIVLGAAGVLVLDVSNPASPVVAARLRTSDVGRVVDATQMAGRIFLLGERGLQMLDARSARVEQSIDVVARLRLARMGRHLVTVGAESLQIVDSTPLGAAASSASPAQAGAGPD